MTEESEAANGGPGVGEGRMSPPARENWGDVPLHGNLCGYPCPTKFSDVLYTCIVHVKNLKFIERTIVNLWFLA